MKHVALIAAGMLTAMPAMADGPNTIGLMRDSDGLVISVLYPVDWIGGPGGIYYTMGGEAVSFSNDAGGMTASAGGTAYQVEAKGADIWLLDPTTGTRLATERHTAPDAAGLRVNPAAFDIE
jgi:hypothetical protein